VLLSLNDAEAEPSVVEWQEGVTREPLHAGVIAEKLYPSKENGTAADAADLPEEGTVQNKGKKKARAGRTMAAALPHEEEHGNVPAAAARQALFAATAAGDLEVLCHTIDEHAAVADAADLATARAARHTLRKGKKKAMRSSERTKAALLMLQVATDIDSLSAALQTAEGMVSVACELAAEMMLARERLERWKIAARAEANARTIDEFDAHLEQIQLHAATPAREEPSMAGPSSQSADDGTLCVVCIDSDRTHAFLPCGHNVCCGDCCAEIMAGTKECPVCRATCLIAGRIYR
jgi:hypothetical protein